MLVYRQFPEFEVLSRSDRLPRLAGLLLNGNLVARFQRASCVEGRDDPGYRFAQPGANVLAALSGCWLARRRRARRFVELELPLRPH
jgi:hypothetical protein